MEQREGLETFLVRGLVPTGRLVGRGAFGRVEEVNIPGAVCAAKRIHDELLRTEEATDLTTKFVKECKLMSTLRHPHIVQFLGICYLPDAAGIPALVMEKLDCDLHKLLETVTDIPLSIKKSILTDIANGLVYLHGQAPAAIIHRDLTARNVLLNSALTAKIGDLGVARIVNLTPGQLAATMSKGPGNIVYMPPEATEDHPKYNTSLDVFSFGNLVLFTLTQEFPNLKNATYVDVKTKKLCPRSEIDRRIESLNQLVRELGDEKHHFISLAKQCLQNIPTMRPSAIDIILVLSNIILVPHRLWDCSKMDMIKDILACEAEGRRVQWRELNIYRDLANGQQREGDQSATATYSEHKPLRQYAQSPPVQLRYSSSSNTSPVQQEAIRSISWRGVRRMPKRLECAQSVVLQGSVYVAGSERTIFQYSIDQDQWHELPCRPPQKYFSMTVLNDNLVLVGGFEVSGIFSQDVSNKISIWDPNSRKWTHPYPCIPAARYAVSSVGYKGYLILAGGRQHVPEDPSLISHQIEVPSLSTVEILDSATSTWYSGDPLPFECHAMQASVIGDTLYLLGGRNRFDFMKSVVWASLPSLISKACQPSPTSAATTSHTTPPYCWNVLPLCPYFTSSIPYYAMASNHGDGNTHDDRNHGIAATNTCTMGSINVPLLAIGGHTGLQLSLLGEYDRARVSREIHAYSHVTGGWMKIEGGELPEACVGCSCCVLPSGELFVAGGGRFESPLNSAYIGTFQK